ncbi:response regulator [Bacteroidia bacterium]|nr:response regulator [Bacteroidia bacterium]
MIFLIDDDPIQNLITSQPIITSLPNKEFKVFNNGLEALESIASGDSPSLTLLDINMPIMNGWEFLEEYKKHPNKAPTVMLSSSQNEEDISKSKEFDFVSGYYSKPINRVSIKEIFQLS